MKICDISIAYNESSGGIRTYIDEKRRYLLENTTYEHLLIVPGDTSREDRHGRITTVQIESPLLPNQDAYRFFLQPAKIRKALLENAPDIIELGSYYLSPWAAFAYRHRLQKRGKNCLIGCYFHTDVAEAYVAAPLKAIAHDLLDERSETLSALAEGLADIAATGVEHYVRSIFRHCDLALASSPEQAERLHEYGVGEVQIVPMGVDLELFRPELRGSDVRRRYGACADDLVLIYAGRLSSEKHVLTLLQALDLLPKTLNAKLWLVGEGPLKDELSTEADSRAAVTLLPYENDRLEFGRLLASADIYVTAGPHETFGLSVIEAQAVGLPVVGVDAGALHERVPPELGFLGPVDDAKTMAQNICTLAHMDRKAIGQKARTFVEENFSWDATFRRWLQCYTTALKPIQHLLPSALIGAA